VVWWVFWYAVVLGSLGLANVVETVPMVWSLLMVLDARHFTT
jgi:hypothetical protein